MTESEWLGGTNLMDMLEHLRTLANARKLRLFAAACCRRLWPSFGGRWGWVVDLAERYADGEDVGRQGRAAFDQDIWVAFAADPDGFPHVIRSLGSGFDRPPGESATLAQIVALSAWFARPDAPEDEEPLAQLRLLRCVFGNPFRPVSLRPAWLTPDVLSLAQAAYEHRTLPAGTLEPERLSLLADALEDAGCTQTDLLGHLRSGGPHVRGCWALDLIPGRE
jgi:hypothetical protein